MLGDIEISSSGLYDIKLNKNADVLFINLVIRPPLVKMVLINLLNLKTNAD